MRIVAAGCSMTYGHGLSDCFVPPGAPGTEPSKFAWPSVVASKLGYKCLNLSRPGGGNDNIVKELLQADLKSTDTVIVLWSFLTRTMEFKADYTEHYGEWDEDYMRNLFEYSNASDLEIKTLIKVHNFTKYLESLGVTIKYMFMNKLDLTPTESPYFNLTNKLWNSIKQYDITPYTFDPVQTDLDKGRAGGFALDKRHPGEKWHSMLGGYIFKTFSNTLI